MALVALPRMNWRSLPPLALPTLLLASSCNAQIDVLGTGGADVSVGSGGWTSSSAGAGGSDGGIVPPPDDGGSWSDGDANAPSDAGAYDDASDDPDAGDLGDGPDDLDAAQLEDAPSMLEGGQGI